MQDQSWVNVQKRVFTNWVNTYLVERMMKIESLENDFQTGLNLIALLEIISSKTLPPHNKKIRVKNQCLENLSFCLKFLENEGIKLVNIAPEDIYDNNLKLILGLIWTIILRYQIQVEEGKSAKNELLEWVRSKIPEYNINNFTGDWTSGKPICALANAVEPGLFHLPQDFSNNPLSDANMGISNAKSKMGIPDILLPEDMVLNPDELSNMTYISYYRDYENKKLRDMADSEKLKIPVAQFCTAYGPGLEGGEALVPTHFTIETRNYKNQSIPIDHNPYNVAITGPNGSVQHHINPEGDGKFRVDYTPTKDGNHKIAITLSEQNISKSPYNVKISASNADPHQCRVWGNGVQNGDAGEPKEIFMEPRNSQGEKINLDNVPFNVQVKGPYGPINVELKKGNDGVYVGKYKADDPGKYHIDVNLGKTPIANSPYEISLDRPVDESDPTRTYADGPGLKPGNSTTKPCHFNIYALDKFNQPRRVGGDHFDVTIEDPNFDLINAKLKDNNDGTYSVDYHPTIPGKYRIDVVQRNKANPLFYEHVSNSPIEVVIEPGIDASQCTAHGPGLEDGVKDTLPTHFTIQAKDSQGNKLTEGGDKFDVKINGPSGPIQPKVTDNRDGTYTVEYAPDKAGNHKIDVTLDGAPIKGAPFTVNVKPGADHSKSFIERFTFIIRTRDKAGKNRTTGGDKVTVTIVDPRGQPLKGVQVNDTGDGTYLVVYSLPEDYVPGEYLIHCQIDERDIKGSPWKQIFL